MLTPARKLAAIAIACAASLLSVAPVASGSELGAQFEAAGLGDAHPLSDSQMSRFRGTGFATGLSSSVFSLLSQGHGISGPNPAASNGPGSFGDFLAALFGGLPPINLVAAELNDQPTVMLIGTAAQSLSCGSGITCPAGMTIYLSANNQLPPGALSLNLAITH